MAAKGQESNELKKRKRLSATESEGEKSNWKKVKVPSNKAPKKPFGSSKQKPHKFKQNFAKSDASDEKTAPKTKRERRLQAKELTEARKKKRKPYYTLEQELALLWEKMRRRNLAKEDRSKFVSEALKKMKGKIPEIASSHVSSRVLQTCVKYCSHAERDDVFVELRPHFLILACNTYAVHLVKKMLDNASKNQLSEFISLLHGHVAPLLRHMVGSVVIEHAYHLGNATQKQALLMELYSPELQLFKDLLLTKESRLEDIITKLGLKKASVSRHMISVFQPILEKGIVDHSIIHKALMEYFSITDQASAADVIRQLSGIIDQKVTAADVTPELSGSLLVRMIHTREGSRIAMLCLKHGSAKERKQIIKGMKGHVGKVAHDQYGSLVVASIFSIVDDTKLVTKIIIRELQKVLKELLSDKNGRRSLLQLLHPNCTRYFSPDDLASFKLSIPSLLVKGNSELIDNIDKHKKSTEEGEDRKNSETEDATAEPNKSTRSSAGVDLIEGGKKDPLLRRQELLVNSGLAESLIDTCIESAGDLLRSNFGKEIVYEVVTGGADGILLPTLDSKLDALHRTIASLVAQQKSEGEEEEHLLENFHSSRTIRKLVLDSPSFASTLWKNALVGKCEMWAQGHSSKVLGAFLESSYTSVRKTARKELQPLIDSGILKLPGGKPSTKAGN